MKKSLVALGLMSAFAGTAFAQSATLYGTLDVGYGIGNSGIYEGQSGVDSKFQQWGNGRATSLWGLSGSEDLGNGLSAFFNLESEIDPENGAGGGFDRVAILGLTGSFGTIQAGRQSTVSSNIMSEFDVSGAPGLTSSLGNAGISGDAQRFSIDTYDRVDSALVYISPEFSGFQFQAGVVLENDDILGLGSNGKNVYTLGGTYNYGGFTIGASYESKLADGMSASWGIGAKYDFGSFLVSASYFDNHLNSDGRGLSLGVAAPVGAFTVGAQVAYNMKAYSPVTGDEIKPLAWELFATYDLSRRTQLYVQYGGIDSDAEEFNGATRKYSAAFGLIHNF